MSEYQFVSSIPTNYLWVDANAAPGGDGSAEHPFNTIQAAVNLALPGTAIMVKAGEYHENVKVPRNVNGTADAPIQLVSADGPQAAHIIAPSSTAGAIMAGGTENFIVDGFWVTGGKNGIQFSMNGADYTDLIKNIVVTNNLIDGFVEDGVKMNGGENVLVSNNVIKGGIDEGIDFVAIVNGVISGNDVSGNAGTSAGIFAKFGSENIVIKDNYVHDNAAVGISVGGYVNVTMAMRAGYDTFQAKNVVVEGNVVTGSGRAPITVFGSVDVTIKGNYLEANTAYYTAVYVGSSNATMYGTFGSHGVTITDNFLTDHFKPLTVDANSDGVLFEDNACYLATALVQSLHLSTGTPPPPPPIQEEPPANTGDGAGDQVQENSRLGTDTVYTDQEIGSTVVQRQANAYHLPENIENLIGTGIGQGLRGNSLNNVITAGAGGDYVDLHDGGSDTLHSGDSRDTIYYGAALDSTDVNDLGDEAGDTRGDLLVIQGNYDITLGAGNLIDVEKFRIQKGSYTGWGDTAGNLYSYDITTVDGNVAAGGKLVVQGGSLQLGEHLKFDASAETDGTYQMFGGRDSDELIGGAQFDHLLGRVGNDILTGNGGDDRLRGGLGADTMDGGVGADIIVYATWSVGEVYTNPALESTGTGYDTIKGFTFAEDRIDLLQTVSGLASVNTGALSTASFNADLAAAINAALNPNGAVLFNTDGGDLTGKTFLIIDADGDGSYQADLDYVIQLLNPTGTPPATPDFFL